MAGLCLKAVLPVSLTTTLRQVQVGPRLWTFMKANTTTSLSGRCTHGLPSASPSTLVPTSGKTMTSVQQVGHGKGCPHGETVLGHTGDRRGRETDARASCSSGGGNLDPA